MGIRPHDGRPSQRPVTPDTQSPSKHGFRSVMLQRFQGLFSRHDSHDEPIQHTGGISWPDRPPPQSKRDWSIHPPSIGLPRQATLRRLNSERKEHLTPVEPCAAERRAASTARPNKSVSVARRTRASSTPPLYHPAALSAPVVPFDIRHDSHPQIRRDRRSTNEDLAPIIQQGLDDPDIENIEVRPPRPPSITSSAISQHPDVGDDIDEKALIKAELDSKWILNLSMHFRDKSDREKFFVTYAETPTRWRRVTVSCDYRNAEPGSLEMDLKELQFQRDKSLQIYESIRDSLAEIQFYDTVTNLKLETTEGRLHVHVTEDVNETIPYPPRGTVAHILNSDQYQPQEVSESELKFESHLSGFVYKVSHNGRVYIKKEIPGPDTVDEFLYEINALHALHGSRYVIQLEAIVVDDDHQLVKGLLISYAERGAIVDLLYDMKGCIPLEDRLRWGRDAVAGLSEIHDEGYVQGDFTLSNIVVDDEGHAKIIDINRRGCPVGWEPPEIAVKIASHQRISMYIGEKSDLYQLGMTLWGLAADDDEPERHDPPVSVEVLPSEVPSWFKDIIRICLDPKPKNRRPARDLLPLFAPIEVHTPTQMQPFTEHFDFREQKRYIDPNNAVEREDLERFGQADQKYNARYSPASSQDRRSFTYPRSSSYNRGSETSEYERPRGRTPPRNIGHLRQHERRGWSTEEVSISSEDDHEPQILSVSPRVGPQYDEIELDGKPFLIARNTFGTEDVDFLSRESDQTPAVVADKDTRYGFSEGLVYDSQTSAGSSSTAKQNTSIVESSSQVYLGPENDLGNNADEGNTDEGNTGETNRAKQSSSLSPDVRRTAGSISPQPPPSLSYADSGFHEPAEDELLPEPYQALLSDDYNADSIDNCPKDTCTPYTSDVGQMSLRASGAAAPPAPLIRSDTSFRVPVRSSEDCESHGVQTPKVSHIAVESTPEGATPLLSANVIQQSMAAQSPLEDTDSASKLLVPSVAVESSKAAAEADSQRLLDISSDRIMEADECITPTAATVSGQVSDGPREQGQNVLRPIP